MYNELELEYARVCFIFFLVESREWEGGYNVAKVNRLKKSSYSLVLSSLYATHAETEKYYYIVSGCDHV